MNLPFQFLRHALAPTLRDAGAIRLVPRTEVQWGGPVFRAPSLPTPQQLNTEVPFFVNFRSKQNPAR